MRDGYQENWTCNDPANSVLTIDSSKNFFAIPYLVGTRGGTSADSIDRAMDTIAEFFISLLGKMSAATDNAPFLTESFVSNALLHCGYKCSNCWTIQSDAALVQQPDFKQPPLRLFHLVPLFRKKARGGANQQSSVKQFRTGCPGAMGFQNHFPILKIIHTGPVLLVTGS